ncbi:MAG: phospho-N-acetylmuramoyl-pentapeptide-transferase [Deltaproteobacteria bacterium]|nr:phospho-N-acetylmuramoyl-pentapeptide-transferase [Deltaproteobacteria bacterium]
MLYHLLYPLHDQFAAFNVFRYITFRTFAAMFTAMIIYFVFGRFLIAYMQRKQFWQSIRDDGPIMHLQKGKTPTMGGLLIWAGVLFATIMWARLDNPYVFIVMGVGIAYALIGFLDDYRKIILRDSHGLRARYKFPLQVGVALFACLFLFDGLGFDRHLAVPFVKSFYPLLSTTAFVALASFIVVGTSNAVNLTDGLDGLVAVPAIMAFFAYAILSYTAGHMKMASYLAVPFIPGAGELTIICGGIMGALIGFLWFNAQPADIFMGDVGALPLGAVLGMIAVITKNELLLTLVGGIFMLETVSVITQVISFKLTGKRVFRMAPLHHHFELKGWKESKVIVRFWIIALILALLSLSTLKLR